MGENDRDFCSLSTIFNFLDAAKRRSSVVSPCVEKSDLDRFRRFFPRKGLPPYIVVFFLLCWKRSCDKGLFLEGKTRVDEDDKKFLNGGNDF